MVARAYDSAIRPIHLGRRLVRALEAAADAPTTGWEVALHPRDRAAFDRVARHLERELAEALTQHAERLGLRHASPFEVRLSEDATVAEGDFEVRGTHAARREAPADATGPSPADPTGDGPEASVPTRVVARTPAVSARIVRADGGVHELVGYTVIVGRQSTCGLVLADPNVSREHAQLRRGPGGWTVLDLGSTNGTRINGTPVSGEQLLADGDEVAFGSVGVRFEIA